MGTTTRLRGQPALPDVAEPAPELAERPPAGPPRVIADVVSRALYLQTEPDPVFATIHLPVSVRADATGVVLCPPFGWPEMCTYRTRRTWADALARAGHPAIRIDLPGTGDSAGSPRSPDRLAAWTAAVAAAARFLRQETGCERVAGVGIGLGGMLVWLAATQGAPIDDLVLWAVPSQGRRLLREMRASAALEIDTRLEPEYAPSAPAATAADSPDAPEDHGLLEMAGRVVTQDTVDSLARIDLTKLPLSDPTRRRVLLLERDGAPGDAALLDYLNASGAEVTVMRGEGYGAMMQYARYAEIPEASIAHSISWLSDARPGSPPRSHGGAAGPSEAPVQTSESLEIRHGGVAIRETPLAIQLESGRLRGILTEPADGATADVCGVLFNAGSDRRTGPNRAWVETARRWAARGVPTVRFDQPGIGDSDGEQSSHYDEFAEYYDPRITNRTIATLNELEALGLPGRFVLVGFCAGAYWSFQGALADKRVAGAFAINLPFFFWNWWSAHVLHGWWIHRKRRSDDSWLVRCVLWSLKRASRFVPRARRVVLRPLRRAPHKLNTALKRLSDQGTEVLLLFRSGEPLYDDLVADGRIDCLLASPNVHVKHIPGSDHTFRPLPLQRYVSHELDDALTGVLESEARRPLVIR